MAWDQLFSISTRKRELGNSWSQRKSMRRVKLWKDSFRCLPECLKPSLVMPNSQIVMKNKMNRKEKDTCLRSVERQGKDIIWFYIGWIFYYICESATFLSNQTWTWLLNSTESRIEGCPNEVLLMAMLIILGRVDKRKLSVLPKS